MKNKKVKITEILGIFLLLFLFPVATVAGIDIIAFIFTSSMWRGFQYGFTFCVVFMVMIAWSVIFCVIDIIFFNKGLYKWTKRVEVEYKEEEHE